MIENRRHFRLPFRSKIILGSDDQVITGNAMNISAGGLFVMTLLPFTRDTHLKCVFLIDEKTPPIVTQVAVKRVVASTVNLDETPGLGISFIGVENKDLDRIRKFMDDNRHKFELAATLLSSGEPDLHSLEPLLETMHLPKFTDMGELRFFVERILKTIESVEETHGTA
jgi:hypothetical protein